MGGGCVYDCVHPWWGGRGTCVVGGDDGSAVCVCDAGYASRGATGNPACSPKRVIVATYITVSVISAVATAILYWQIAQYRHLPTQCRSSRKTATRMKALCSMSVYVLGSGILGAYLAAQAGDKGYIDPGVIQSYYIGMVPAMLFGMAMVGEYWVMNLPSQLIAPGSVADVLVGVIEKYDAFFFVGCFNAGGSAAFGVLAFVHPILAANLSDLVIAGGITSTVSVIAFVAVQITGYIDQATLKASASSRAFYAKAKTHLWQQAAALCGVGIVTLVDVAAKHLTVLGRSTPILVNTVQVLTAHIASIMFAIATRFPDPAATKSPGSACSPRSPGKLQASWAIRSDGNTAATSSLPLNPRPSELQRGDLENVGTATLSESKENVNRCLVNVKPNHGDNIPPGGKPPSRHRAAKINNSVVPR